MQTDIGQPELQSLLLLMYRNFPDVVNIDQLCVMLGNISTKTAYKLLQAERIQHFKIGRIYKIPKIYIIEYLATVINGTSPSSFHTLPH
ncbi:helix-turn-helix domain-containing protein [Paenibacillus sp. FSL H7-0716]|uniref:Uncharacterized protein n=2 Tax=Paenibacillus TaxID=44249 RepID=A0A1R0Y836_9BACL|nr:helix-turn-helix domain-containing protein [Paenibacillus odorifer]OMD43518.1 hypothetical protein BSK52_03665 [Paenibacillus odorifer]OME16591.1 hypothetical protein BSK47_20250 [Paenibacillus odorifer]